MPATMPALPGALRARGEASAYLASIRVVGVGGGGLNALQRMIDADIHGVEFVAINTDAQQLAMSDATVKLQIGRELTSGLGSGADPELGRKAAEDSIDRLRQVLRGSDLVFVTAGEGGGTGTGAAPVIARAARELGALTVGIVTMPFGFEGKRRSEAAQVGLEALQDGRRHAHRRAQRPPARGARARRLDGRRLPHGRRRAAPGRAGHLRPDHASRRHQPRLRRRAHRHAGVGLRAHGHRHGDRPGARPRGRAARARLAADRPAHPRRDRRPALDHGAARADAAGGHGGGRGRARGRRRPGQHHLRHVGRRLARRSAVGDRDRDWLRAPGERGAQASPSARATARRCASSRSTTTSTSRPSCATRTFPGRRAGCDRRRASGHGGGRSRGAARRRLGRRRVRRRGVRVLDRRAGADGARRRRLPRRLRRPARGARSPSTASWPCRARPRPRARRAARALRRRLRHRAADLPRRPGLVRRARRHGRARGGAPPARAAALGRAGATCRSRSRAPASS